MIPSAQYRKLLIILTGCLLISSGCATIGDSRRSPERSDTRQPAAPAAPKVGEKLTLDDEQQPDRIQPPYDPSSTQVTQRRGGQLDTLSHFLARHLDPALPLSSDDRILLNDLVKPAQSASLAEAVLAIAAIKATLHPQQGQAQGYEETDYLAPARQQAASKVDIVTMAAKYQVNLLRAIARNPFLQDGRIWEMSELAMLCVDETPTSFVTQLQEMLQRRSARWEQLAARASQLGSGDDSDTTSQPLAYNKSRLSPADLRSGDALLMEAQTLADQKRYKDAIDRVSLIQRSSPFYPKAQEKIRNLSNQAVQELRQKAAIAFQSAIPVSDPKAKLAYLEEARDYLQQALNEFPTADQLNTVRENLSVISRDLQQLADQIVPRD